MKTTYFSIRRAVMALTAAIVFTLLAGCAQKGADSSNASAASTTAASTTAASTTTAAKATVRVVTIQGPTGVGMANLMEQDKNGATVNDYEFEVVATPEEAKARLASGNADVAAIPTNMAATLYNKLNGSVRVMAVNTLGVLHILENGNAIQSVADLRGKTIYSTGQGANPEYVLNYVLTKNGLDPQKDVTISFVAQNEELVTKLASNSVSIAMVPEPMATTVMTKNSALRRALDMTAEWDKVAESGSRLMMGCVVGREAFLSKNAAAAATFLTEYEDSIHTAITDVDGTATLCETYGIIAKAALAKQAIPGCNLTFVAGADMKTQLSGYLQVLFHADAKAVGGAMPAEAFYYAVK